MTGSQACAIWGRVFQAGKAAKWRPQGGRVWGVPEAAERPAWRVSQGEGEAEGQPEGGAAERRLSGGALEVKSRVQGNGDPWMVLARRWRRPE